tara:strand:- start:873 stop:3293 length:2421 start_codon:yes stop_codon:yes gene_type:complete
MNVPVQDFRCLCVEDSGSQRVGFTPLLYYGNFQGQTVGWGDGTNTATNYASADHGDYENVTNHSDPDSLGGSTSRFKATSNEIGKDLGFGFYPVNGTGFETKFFMFMQQQKTLSYFQRPVEGITSDTDDDTPTTFDNQHNRFYSANAQPSSLIVTFSGNTVTRNAHGLSDGQPVSFSHRNSKYDWQGSPGSNGSYSSLFVSGATDYITLTGHGLTAGQRVSFHSHDAKYGLSGTSYLPTGLAENTRYYVLSSGLSTDTFKISTTDGGSAVTWSGQGTQYQSSDIQIYYDLPTGVVRGKTYYVINSSTNDFQISETVGGSAITASGSGHGELSMQLWSAYNTWPNGAFGVTVQGRLVTAGLHGLENELHISGLNKYFDWRTNSSGGSTSLATDGAIIDVSQQWTAIDQIKGLGVLEGDKLVVFGENETLIYITDTDINNWTIATDFRIKLGLFGRNTLANVGQDLFFCSKSGIHSIRRAVSGLTLETQTYTREVSDLWTKLVADAPKEGEQGKSGTLDHGTQSSYDNLHTVNPEPHAWWDEELGHYTVVIPTVDATKWARLIMIYEKGTGKGEFKGFTFTPPLPGDVNADDGIAPVATCGSYFGMQGSSPESFRETGISSVVVGTTKKFVSSGVSGVNAAHPFFFRTPVLFQGQPDTYKYYKRLIIRCHVVDTLSSDGVATDDLFPQYLDSTMTLQVKIYDELGNLRHTAEVTPDVIAQPIVHTEGYLSDILGQYNPLAETGDTNDVGVNEWSKHPIEIPIAIRARGISIGFDNKAYIFSNSTANGWSYLRAHGFVFSDFGLIVDTK